MTALTPLQIRAATLDDATALAALSAQLGYATTPEQLRQRLAWLQQHGEPVWLACVDGAIAGYLACQRYVTLYLAPGLNITALVVASTHQQQGIGRRLLDHAADYARQHQLAFLRANSGASREAAHHFYRRVGFAHEKDQKHFMRDLTDSAAP